MKRSIRFELAIAFGIALGSGSMVSAHAEPSPRLSSPPFTTTLSNHPPLSFGMDPASAAEALQAPLTYVSGRRGNEIFMALSTNGGNLFFGREDRLYLQFRHGRLTGWKGDWNLDTTWR